MLAYYHQGIYKPWNGEAVNAVRHPLNIEQIWTDQQLADAGLFRVTPFVPPAGYIASGVATYEMSGSVVVENYATVEKIPVTEIISDRQFAQALRKLGFLTHEEAMAFVQTGTIPDALMAVVNAIQDQEQRQDVEMLLCGAIEFRRHHPVTLAVAATMNWTEEQVDDLWTLAASL